MSIAKFLAVFVLAFGALMAFGGGTVLAGKAEAKKEMIELVGKLTAHIEAQTKLMKDGKYDAKAKEADEAAQKEINDKGEAIEKAHNLTEEDKASLEEDAEVKAAMDKLMEAMGAYMEEAGKLEGGEKKE